MNIDIVYLGFVVAALGLVRWFGPARGALLAYLGGWVLLPVGHYPVGSAGAAFPYWITGLAVPSDMLLTKAWVAAAAPLLGVLLFDARTLAAGRPRGCDAAMLLWCAWPLAQSVLASAPGAPTPVLACLYLCGTWGLPWLIGRLYFGTPQAQQELLRALALSALACLPIGLLEGWAGPWVYDSLFEPHPFRSDGAVRYVGFRPLGMFEDGNQYGLWLALCALAALWLAAVGRWRGPWTVVAAAIGALAAAAQSVGALLLLGLGAVGLALSRVWRPRVAVIALAALLLVGGSVYLSGVVPVMQIGRSTALGRHVVDGLRAVGRGSFAWRISQDQKVLELARQHPLVGSGQWDWWRPAGIRPWGLWMLVLGQFGVVGLAAALAAWLGTSLRVAWNAPRASGWRPSGRPLVLAALVVLAAFDGLLNSFIFSPALLVAGALARSGAETVSVEAGSTD